MENVYYLSVILFPALLYVAVLKKTGDYEMWLKILFTSFVLGIVVDFLWTDTVTDFLCTISDCPETTDDTISGRAKDAFFGAAFTEELQKCFMAALLILILYRKRGINALGVFKVTLASGAAFGMSETLGKVRYNVMIFSNVDKYWNSSAFHMKNMLLLLKSDLVHFLLAVVMASFFAKALKAEGNTRLMLLFAGLGIAVAMHFVYNFRIGLFSGIAEIMVALGLAVYIVIACVVWKKCMKDDVCIKEM